MCSLENVDIVKESDMAWMHEIGHTIELIVDKAGSFNCAREVLLQVVLVFRRVRLDIQEVTLCRQLEV